MLTARERLQNMLDVLDQLESCVERRHLTEEDIVGNVDIRWMVSTPIAYLSEQAAKMLFDHRDVAERFAEIDWHSLRGPRNRIVHDYDGVNFSLLAAYVLEDAPSLRPLLRTALAELGEKG